MEAAEIAGVAPGSPERRAPLAAASVSLAAKRDAAQDIAHIMSGALTIAEEDPQRATAASMAKAAAGECQRLVVQDGLQLHGGIGMTWEHDLHFLLKRAVAGDTLYGNAVHHRARLARMLGFVAESESSRSGSR